MENLLTFYLERIFAIFPSGSSLATRIKRLEGGVCWLATGQQPNTAILKGTTVPDNKLSQKSKYLSCDPKRHRDRDSYSEQCRGPSFGPHGPPHKQNDPIFLHLGDLVDHFNFVIHHLCKNQIVVISGLLLNDGLWVKTICWDCTWVYFNVKWSGHPPSLWLR